MPAVITQDPNMKIGRTNNTNRDFVELTAQLDAELNERYGTQQSEYDKYNKIVLNDTVIVGFLNDFPVACGCFKNVDSQTVEIKRMYVQTGHRRKGLSTKILQALENWASELGYSKAVLETGKGQPEAIALYKKCGYQTIENYGPYKNLENSVCMEKLIKEGLV